MTETFHYATIAQFGDGYWLREHHRRMTGFRVVTIFALQNRHKQPEVPPKQMQ